MNIGVNYKLLLKRAYNNGDISQKQLVNGVHDFFVNTSDLYKSTEANRLGCKSREDLITKLVPKYVYDCWKNQTDPKLRKLRQERNKYRTGGIESKRRQWEGKRIDTTKVRYFARLFEIQRQKLEKFYDQNTSNVNNEYSSSVAAKNKWVNSKLREQYGYIFDWLKNRDPSTFSRYGHNYHNELRYVEDKLYLKTPLDDPKDDPFEFERKRFRYNWLEFFVENQEEAIDAEKEFKALSPRERFVKYGHSKTWIQVAPSARGNTELTPYETEKYITILDEINSRKWLELQKPVIGELRHKQLQRYVDDIEWTNQYPYQEDLRSKVWAEYHFSCMCQICKPLGSLYYYKTPLTAQDIKNIYRDLIIDAGLKIDIWDTVRFCEKCICHALPLGSCFPSEGVSACSYLGDEAK